MQVAGTVLLELIANGVTAQLCSENYKKLHLPLRHTSHYHSNPLATHSYRNQAPRNVPAASPGLFWTVSRVYWR